jgi:hypothetical protein
MSHATTGNAARGLHIPPRAEYDSVTMYETPSTVIVSPPDATTADQMSIIEVSGSLSFWGAPEEDRYTHDDGKPV